MAKKSDIYVAVESFVVGHDLIQAGVTRVRAGHPIMKGRERFFKLLDVHYEVEAAEAPPEPVRKVEIKQKPKPEPKKDESKPEPESAENEDE